MIVLQLAFAGLVADAAIDRVIQRQQLHHRLAILLHQFGIGLHAQPLADRHIAGDLDPAAPLDLNRADPAVAGDRELRMPAEIRHLDAVRDRRFDHGLVAFGLNRPAVYEDFRHSSWPLKRERLFEM